MAARQPQPQRSARTSLHPPLAFVPLLLALTTAASPALTADWLIVTDIRAAAAEGAVHLDITGPPQAPFLRPSPLTIDKYVLGDYQFQLSVLQDLRPNGEDTPFVDTAEQYVATLRDGFVEGEGGLVWDAAGRVYHLPHFFFTRASPMLPLPQRGPAEAAASCERPAPVLASVVQRYGHMYYHFLEESLPRVALLMESGRLTSDVKLLTWGQPWEYEFLELLGVSPTQVVPYNASKVYCADRLLVPTPTPRITPPREGLVAVRRGLGVETLPEAERNLLVYVSRRREASRRVASEEQLLAAIRTAFPSHPLVVFSGDLPAQQTVQLFQRARVVLGPHGAGLSHIMFAAPGTAVVEFLFLADPPLMFWHTAAALGQQYWLLPVPQAFYMQAEMQVPVDEVLDILTAVLAAPPTQPTAAAARLHPSTACPPGSTMQRPRAGGLRCTACEAGSYAFNPGSPACKPCPPGRAAPTPGAAACRTCQPGTFSSPDRAACLPCLSGTFSILPGAWEPSQCLTPEQRRQQQEDQAGNVELLSKLSPVFAEQRRRLIEQGTPSGQLSPAQLCAAQQQQQQLAGSWAGPYRSPYLLPGAITANCSVIDSGDSGNNTSGVPVVVAVVAAPAPAPAGYSELPGAPTPLALPPLDVPTLPPSLLASLAPVAAPTAAAPGPAPTLPRDTQQQPRTLSTGTPSALASPSPSPALPPTATSPPKKRVVDDYVIILACVLGGLLVLPALAWFARRCYLARQRHKSRITAYSNPTYRPAAAVDAGAPARAGGSGGGLKAPLM